MEPEELGLYNGLIVCEIKDGIGSIGNITGDCLDMITAFPDGSYYKARRTIIEFVELLITRKENGGSFIANFDWQKLTAYLS